jgi:hypothetical protein
MQSTSTVGLSLRGWLLDAAACTQLKRASKLRVLQMECQVGPKSLALLADNLRWLGVRVTGDAPELHLELLQLPHTLVSMSVHGIACA